MSEIRIQRDRLARLAKRYEKVVQEVDHDFDTPSVSDVHEWAELRKQLQQHFSVMCSKHALMWPKTAAEARGPRPQLRTRALDSVVRRMTSQNGWQRMRVRKDEVSEDEA